MGKFAFADDDYAINQDLTALVSKNKENLAPEFIHVIAPHIASVVERNAEGIGVRGVTRAFLSDIQIPLPPLDVQKEVVAEIEGYQNEINRLKIAITDEEKKIQATLARVWGEEEQVKGDHPPAPSLTTGGGA